ncbi:hypothetical protein ABFA25_00530 [Mycobacterium lepromatosis]
MLGAVSPREWIVCIEDASELAPWHLYLAKRAARCRQRRGGRQRGFGAANLSGRRYECDPTASWSAMSGVPEWPIYWQR